MEAIKFQPWSSAPDVSFWQRLGTLKLNTFRLNDSSQDIIGYFAPGRSFNVPSRIVIDDSSFPSSDSEELERVNRAKYEWQMHGVLYNTNTLEDFKRLDKAKLLAKASERLYQRIQTPGLISNGALNTFVLVTFADLKKHSFLYWFGFPALAPVPSISTFTGTSFTNIPSILSESQQEDSLKGLLTLASNNTPSFFVIHIFMDDTIQVQTLYDWQVQESAEKEVKQTIFGFVDPCPLPGNPGWPLRNLLTLLAAKEQESKISNRNNIPIISFREHVHHLQHGSSEENASAFREWQHSKVFYVNLGDKSLDLSTDVRTLGWEANVRGKMGPRLMELASHLDPIKLAEQSVDLNLKLMRWRQLPQLDLTQITTTKCLLLGSGTLGCFTARSLLSWGFRHITFVDNSTVSHSNPVRQPLFEFADVGKPKAECAAEALRRIFPLVQSDSVNLTIPMAGHPLSSPSLLDEAKNALETLDQLISTHDVIFLGTDSRESRWLPTVIACAKEKLVINSALGFDSFLVMRHGLKPSNEAKSPSLGCYFCNDIVSPRDSLADRTLDQMCTVTRPGLAPMAAATAVELLVAVLHSPDKGFISAKKPENLSNAMAYIPHQIRGFLNSFEQVSVNGQAFDRCIACSKYVSSAYLEDPFTLLRNACDSNEYLEKLTGLQDLTNAVDTLMIDDLEDSDEDSELV